MDIWEYTFKAITKDAKILEVMRDLDELFEKWQNMKYQIFGGFLNLILMLEG
jgi:hypothetical protein